MAQGREHEVVMDERFMERLSGLWQRAKTPMLVGIAGGSGAGKSTLSAAIRERLGALSVIIGQDSYYRCNGHLPVEERRDINFDHPEAVDLGLLASHLGLLKAGRPIEKPLYDFASHTRMGETWLVEPAPVVIAEGLFLFVDDGLRGLFDLRVFVEADEAVRLARRLRRDTSGRGRSAESVLEQYFKSVKPMHDEFVAGGGKWAHLVVDARSGDGVDEVMGRLGRETEMRLKGCHDGALEHV